MPGFLLLLALRTWPEKTQQAIAEQVGCHKSHVCRIKDQLLTTQQLDPPATVTGKDGKTYPTTKTKATRVNTEKQAVCAGSDEGQRAMVAAGFLEYERAMAKKRLSASGGDRKSGVENLPHPIEDTGKARDKAGARMGRRAKAANTSGRLLETRPALRVTGSADSR